MSKILSWWARWGWKWILRFYTTRILRGALCLTSRSPQMNQLTGAHQAPTFTESFSFMSLALSQCCPSLFFLLPIIIIMLGWQIKYAAVYLPVPHFYRVITQNSAMFVVSRKAIVFVLKCVHILINSFQANIYVCLKTIYQTYILSKRLFNVFEQK